MLFCLPRYKTPSSVWSVLSPFVLSMRWPAAARPEVLRGAPRVFHRNQSPGCRPILDGLGWSCHSQGRVCFRFPGIEGEQRSKLASHCDLLPFDCECDCGRRRETRMSEFPSDSWALLPIDSLSWLGPLRHFSLAPLPEKIGSQ